MTMTVSMGVSVCTGKSKVTLMELLERADQALYRAKEAGKNRVQVVH